MANATLSRSAEPKDVNIADEFVQQRLAKLQFGASLRVVKTDLELKGSLLDAFA